MNRRNHYRPLNFFVVAFLVSWAPWAVAAAIAKTPGAATLAPLLNLAGLIGPPAATVLMIAGPGGRALRADFLDRLVNLRRIQPTTLPVAVALPFAITGLAIVLSLWFGQPADQFRAAAGSGALAVILLTMLLAPVMEETGWHGYGVDSLRAYSGVLRSTLVFGVLWSVWHAPLVFIEGTYQHQLAAMPNPVFLLNFFVSVIPAAVIANWFYYKNDRSVAAAIFLHAMLNASAVLLSTGQVAKCIATLLYIAVAAAIVLIDRATFTAGPRDLVHGLRD